MECFFGLAGRLASGVRILMIAMVASNRDVMQVGDRYEQSYECVGNAAWKRSVQVHTQFAILHTTNCINPTFDTNERHYTCISTYATPYSQLAIAMRILMIVLGTQRGSGAWIYTFNFHFDIQQNELNLQ